MANPRSLLAAVALCAGLVPAAAAAEKSTAAALAQCKSPAAGTFVVLGSGQQRGEPTALLMQERWFADGRIEGVRYLREGRRFTEDRYTGQVKADANCWALVERQGSAGAMADAVALDRLGRPRTSLVVAPSEVLSLRYVAQAPGACRPEQLDGLVTSQQQGHGSKQGAGTGHRSTPSSDRSLARGSLARALLANTETRKHPIQRAARNTSAITP